MKSSVSFRVPDSVNCINHVSGPPVFRKELFQSSLVTIITSVPLNLVPHSVTQPYLKAYLSLLVPQEVVCYILPPGEGVNHERTPAFEIPFSTKLKNHSLFLKEWPSRPAAS